MKNISKISKFGQNIGGPLEQGDIEELADQLYIVCPWHSFDFSLNTGVSSTGLKVKFSFIV